MQKTDRINKVVSSASAMTTTTNSAATSTAAWVGVIIHANVTAVSGTSPTLNVKLQDSADGVSWYDVPSGAMTQITSVSSNRLAVAGPVGAEVRVVCTIGGTTPSFTADIWVTGTN